MLGIIAVVITSAISGKDILEVVDIGPLPPLAQAAKATRPQTAKTTTRDGAHPRHRRQPPHAPHVLRLTVDPDLRRTPTFERGQRGRASSTSLAMYCMTIVCVCVCVCVCFVPPAGEGVVHDNMSALPRDGNLSQRLRIQKVCFVFSCKISLYFHLDRLNNLFAGGSNPVYLFSAVRASPVPSVVC